MTDGLDALGGIDMDPRAMARTMQNREGIEELLRESPEDGDSPAEIFADIVNVHRADIRRLGMALGVDVPSEDMTPERASELLASTIDGDGIELVVMFNEMAEKRDMVLREVLSDDEHEQFMEAKHGFMFTADPGDFEAGEKA